MARVTVKFFATVREITGTAKIETDADDIKGLLKLLREKYGREFEETVIDTDTQELKQFFSCMINGKRIELLDGYETRLSDGDAVALFPPVGGG
jgi:molybdopterin synthase sulfur carrier subunit